MTLGLFIGRLNPPHNGHIETIEKSLDKDEKTMVLLGSPEFFDEQNPYSFKKRKEILDGYFKNTKNLKILEIKDNKSDEIWTKNISEIISKNFPKVQKINFYGGDFENDSAYKTIKKYEKILKKYKINFIENPRKNSFVIENSEKIPISATLLRKALKEKNHSLVEKLTKKEILKNIK